MEPKIYTVDNSMLSTYRTCFRKGFLRYKRDMVLPTTAAPLNFGGAFHEGMKSFLQDGDKNKALVAALGSMKAQEWSEREFRTPDFLTKLLEFMFTQKMPVPLVAPNGAKIIEVDFSYPLLETMQEQEHFAPLLSAIGYTDIHYTGRIDAVAQWDSREVLWDWKTCSALEGNSTKGEAKYIKPLWWEQFHPHGPTPMYCWGYNKISRRNIRTVGIGGVGFSKPTANGQIPKSYEAQFFELTPQEIEEARKRVLLEVERILIAERDQTTYQQFNPDSCLDYFKRCPYLNLCKIPEPNRAAMENIYTIDHWDPAKKELAENLEA